MNKTIKYLILIFLLTFILFFSYSFYLLFNKGLPLNHFKQQIIEIIEINPKINVENISGINLKYNKDKGIYLRIDNIDLKTNFLKNIIRIEKNEKIEKFLYKIFLHYFPDITQFFTRRRIFFFP